MYSLLIGGCGVVNLQTSSKIIAKIRKVFYKRKVFIHYFALYSVQRWVLSSQTTIDGVKT